ncbi:MAG: hypothetical protein RLZZ262_2128 [Bacteroidota bacterium]|jgi:hypothetical protein
MLKIQFILCNALALMIGVCTLAQTTGEIHGKVLDETGQPVPGVIVTASVGDRIIGSTTDENGKYRIKPLDGGVYVVTVKANGFSDYVYEAIRVEPDKIALVDETRLSLEKITGPVIRVTPTVKLIRYDADMIQTISAEDLKNNASAPAGDINKIVLSAFSDIKASPNGDELYFRGSRAGSVLYFVDGMKIRDNSLTIPTSGISSLSVYTGGMPAKYGDTTGGVIVIQTKNYLQELYKKQNQ